MTYQSTLVLPLVHERDQWQKCASCCNRTPVCPHLKEQASRSRDESDFGYAKGQDAITISREV